MIRRTIRIWAEINDHSAVPSNRMRVKLAVRSVTILLERDEPLHSFAEPFRSRHATHSTVMRLPVLDSFIYGHCYIVQVRLREANPRRLYRETNQYAVYCRESNPVR